MFPRLSEERQEEILIKALTNATEMLSRNTNIYKNIFSDDILADYANKNDSTESRLNLVINKIQTKMDLNDFDVSFVNRALVEYVDTLENAQSHLMYMTEENHFNKLDAMKKTIEEVYIAQMNFNENHINLRTKNEIENDFERTQDYSIPLIVKALNSATDYVIKNGEEIAETLKEENLEDMKKVYTSRNDMALYAISMAKNAVESGRPLNAADVSVVNKAMVQYIQKLEQSQSNMMYTLLDSNDIEKFKERIKEVHFEIFKFNGTFPLQKNEFKNEVKNDNQTQENVSKIKTLKP